MQEQDKNQDLKNTKNSDKINVGIIGGGFVGNATLSIECELIDIKVYDIIREKCKPQDVQIKDFMNCKFIFICVQTPVNQDKKCFTGIVEKVISNLQRNNIDFNQTHVIIRSTVPPGFSDSQNCYFMPEFLTEKNYLNDFFQTKDWIIGCGKDNINNNFLQEIQNLLTVAKNHNKIQNDKIIPMLCQEAEMSKYVRNCFLATKVSFFNEIYSICQASNINYDHMIEGVKCDQRIGESHCQVPGSDGKLGFGGTCFPKDLNAFTQYGKQLLGYNPPIISAVIHRNENIDRITKEWEKSERSQINE